MEHSNWLITDLDRSLKRLEADGICDYRPMFLTGEDKPAHDSVRRWVRGFWKAMALAPGAWSALAEDERTQILIEPFVGFFEIEGLAPLEPPTTSAPFSTTAPPRSRGSSPSCTSSRRSNTGRRPRPPH